ncbi:hypothetical protein ACFY4B_27400 [Kitasatospora sp. NPDC001261]|uniref:hypothetical protein n=1 Tax=Kitasatospora sp. NPDC001261 TaxID=3364012 RepID=UPI0036CC2A54
MPLTAVHIPGCVCEDCEADRTVPLNRATEDQVAALLSGRLADHTGSTLRITVTYNSTAGEIATALPDRIDVEYDERTWSLSHWQLPAGFPR